VEENPTAQQEVFMLWNYNFACAEQITLQPSKRTARPLAAKAGIEFHGDDGAEEQTPTPDRSVQ